MRFSDNTNMRTGARSMRIRTGLALLALSVTAAGCDASLDVVNPNAPVETEVLSSVDAMLAFSIGMQDQYATSVLIYSRAPALITDEWGVRTQALLADRSLYMESLAIDPAYGVVADPYYVTYRIARSANLIMSSVGNLPLAPSLQAALTANAKLFKAMALGMAAQHYERLPLDANINGAVPVPRAQVFAEVISLLESARADILNVPDSDPGMVTFRARATTPNFDLRNSIEAMLARYYLIVGQNQQALNAANRVNLASTSRFDYPSPTRNPINNYSFGLNYVMPLRSFVTQAEAGDARVGYWVNTAGTQVIGDPPTAVMLPFQMYSGQSDPFYLYLPGEVMLIKAEAHARLNNLPAAREQINLVRTKTASAGLPGANLPALTAAQLPDQTSILRQIGYERRYELFSQGLRWEDLRRLGTILGIQPKNQFLPFPDAECRTNPNAGC
jgi:starch-binding outer membrane protein, SusD/RagB family